MRKIKLHALFFSIILLYACSDSPPSDIEFDGTNFSHASTQASSGKKFDIARYESTNRELILITPYENSDLDRFSLVYTATFRAQGFKFKSEGSKHIGVGPSRIVYLTTSPQLKSLSILMLNRKGSETPSIEDSFNIFQELNGLR